MTTSVDLPPALEHGIEEEMKTGQYASKSEVIRTALREYLRERGRVDDRELSPETRERVEKARETGSEDRVPYEQVVED